MGVFFRRFAFGCFWFAIFWVTLLIIGGGLTSATSTKAPPPTASLRQGNAHNYQPDVAAGVEFRDRYGNYVIAGAAILAAIGTATGILPGTRRK